MEIKVVGGDESTGTEYTCDNAIMVLLSHTDDGELNRKLVASSDLPSTYIHAIEACAQHLSTQENAFASVIGKAVVGAVEQGYRMVGEQRE